MENCGEFCEPHSRNTTLEPSSSLAETCTVLRANSVSPIGDTSKSEKLRKISDNRKYRSACLKRYVYAGVKHCRRLRAKKTFVIPVIHVTRRPDNPFNVKNVVENLKKNQMANQISETNQQLPDGQEEYYYSNLEKRIANAKNWETIRYKYQLDYKEKLKMEREKFLKEYAEKKKMAQQQQREENIRTIYQNMEERVKEVSRNANVTKEQFVERSAQKHSHHQQLTESQKFANTSSERHSQAFSSSSRLNLSEESINYYHTDGGRRSNNGCELVDLTTDYESRHSSQRSEATQLRLVRNERRNSRTQVNRNQKVNDSDTLPIPMPQNVEPEMVRTSHRDDFDFSIPFNESKILIKVMTPEGRNPTKVISQPVLQETLSQYATQSIEPQSNATRLDPPSENQWLQYIQNILNKATDPQQDRPVNKTVTFNNSKAGGKSVETNDVIPKNYVDPRSIPTTAAANRKPSVIKVNTAVAAIPHTTNYYDHSIVPLVKQDRPVVSNPRVVRPKVMHPSPYFRPDSLRNNPQFNEKLEDPIGVTQMVPHHQPSAVPMPDQPQPNVPQHMEYLYGSHPSYHPDFNLVRNRQLPLDISHPNLMGPPVYSPVYDQNFVHYRNEMDRIPQPCLDPYIQHGMHVPTFNPSIGYFPPRPAAPGVYRYLNPQHAHPVWYYPHLLER